MVVNKFTITSTNGFSHRMFSRWILIFSLLCCLQVTVAEGRRSHSSPKLFGNVPMPQWMVSVKNSVSKAWKNTKLFLLGEKTISLKLLGRTYNLRFPKFPGSEDQVLRRGSKFSHTLKGDATARLIFALYINIAIVLGVYGFMFVQQVALTIRRRRSGLSARKLKKSFATSTYRPNRLPRVDIEAVPQNTINPPIASETTANSHESGAPIRMRQGRVKTCSMESLNSFVIAQNSGTALTDFAPSEAGDAPPTSSSMIYVEGYEPMPKLID